MGCIRTQDSPGNQQRRQGTENGRRENKSYDLRWRAWFSTEYVVDFLVGRITEGLLGYRERNVGVARDVEIKRLGLVRGRSTKRADDNGCCNWL